MSSNRNVFFMDLVLLNCNNPGLRSTILSAFKMHSLSFPGKWIKIIDDSSRTIQSLKCSPECP